MNRPGRILIIDDAEKWREELIEILQDEGYHATSAPTTNEALDLSSDDIYHVLVLDSRMNEADQSNENGIYLLSELARRGLSEATKVIMLSAYATRERTRTAFKEFEVADFLYKEEFNKQMFLESVRKVFAEKVKTNLSLDMLWQPGNGPEQAVSNLEVAGTPITPGTSLHSQLTNELEDLLCRLFYTAKSILIQPLAVGQSGTGILRAQPFYATSGGGHAVVVKFGDFRKIKQEYDNFKQYVQPFLGGEHTTAIQGLRRTARLGGIIYSLLGTSHDQLADFGEFYRLATALQIQDASEQFFQDTPSNWRLPIKGQLESEHEVNTSQSAENAQNKSPQEHDAFLILSSLARPYIEKAFEYLPWLERNCLLLYADAELTQTDIAEILSLDKKAVHKHLKKASQLWLKAYTSLIEKEIGIPLHTLHMPTVPYDGDLLRVKRLIQAQISHEDGSISASEILAY